MYLKISDETQKDLVLQHVIKAIKYLKKTKIPSFYLKENKRRSNRKQNELTIYQDENDLSLVIVGENRNFIFTIIPDTFTTSRKERSALPT